MPDIFCTISFKFTTSLIPTPKIREQSGTTLRACDVSFRQTLLTVLSRPVHTLIYFWFGFCLNVPVNNFSAMLGRSLYTCSIIFDIRKPGLKIIDVPLNS